MDRVYKNISLLRIQPKGDQYEKVYCDFALLCGADRPLRLRQCGGGHTDDCRRGDRRRTGGDGEYGLHNR